MAELHTRQAAPDPPALGDGWLATCLSSRGESPNAEEAVRQAVGAPLDGRVEELEDWLADLVASLAAAGEA